MVADGNRSAEPNVKKIAPNARMTNNDRLSNLFILDIIISSDYSTPMKTIITQYRHFGKFVVVGLLCTAINYSIFFVCFSVLQLHYIPAAIIAYVLSLSVGYQLNRRWTFNHHQQSQEYWRIFVRYIIVYLFSLALNVGILWILVDRFGMHPLLADILAIGQSTITNFTGLNFFVFQRQHNQSLLLR